MMLVVMMLLGVVDLAVGLHHRLLVAAKSLLSILTLGILGLGLMHVFSEPKRAV